MKAKETKLTYNLNFRTVQFSSSLAQDNENQLGIKHSVLLLKSVLHNQFPTTVPLQEKQKQAPYQVIKWFTKMICLIRNNNCSIWGMPQLYHYRDSLEFLFSGIYSSVASKKLAISTKNTLTMSAGSSSKLQPPEQNSVHWFCLMEHQSYARASLPEAFRTNSGYILLCSFLNNARNSLWTSDKCGPFWPHTCSKQLEFKWIEFSILQLYYCPRASKTEFFFCFLPIPTGKYAVWMCSNNPCKKFVSALQPLCFHFPWHKFLLSQKLTYSILRKILEEHLTHCTLQLTYHWHDCVLRLQRCYNETSVASNQVTSSVGSVICIYLSI